MVSQNMTVQFAGQTAMQILLIFLLNSLLLHSNSMLEQAPSRISNYTTVMAPFIYQCAFCTVTLATLQSI